MFDVLGFTLDILIAVMTGIVFFYSISLGRKTGFPPLWKYIATGFGTLTLARVILALWDVGDLGSDFHNIGILLVALGVICKYGFNYCRVCYDYWWIVMGLF